MALVDLHTHSTASDGTDSPADLVARAADLQMAAIALTDHDTVAGIEPAAQAAARVGIEVVAGIEISARLPGRPAELHLLGYFIDPAGDALRRMNRMLLDARNERNEKIIGRLAELDMPIEQSELAAISDGVVTRAHFAELMLRHGYATTWNEVFRRYLDLGGSAYFDKGRLSFGEAMETIHGAGGLAVLAHPVHLDVETDVELATLVGRLVDAGLDGLEAFHPDQSPAWVRKVQRLAERFDLCVTGGSDYHGMDRAARPLNCQRVDESFLALLRERHAGRHAG